MDIKKFHEIQNDIEKMAAEMLTHRAYINPISGIMYCSYCENEIENMDKDKHKDGCIVNIAKKYINK